MVSTSAGSATTAEELSTRSPVLLLPLLEREAAGWEGVGACVVLEEVSGHRKVKTARYFLPRLFDAEHVIPNTGICNETIEMAESIGCLLYQLLICCMVPDIAHDDLECVLELIAKARLLLLVSYESGYAITGGLKGSNQCETNS